MEYCVATFHSVHEALLFEHVLKGAGLELQLIPVPRELSSSCGIAARFSREDLPDFEAAIAQHQLEVDEIHIMQEQPRKKKSLFNMLD